MWFLLGEEGFHNVFGDRPTKWPIAKNAHQQVHPQLINRDLQEGIVVKGIYYIDYTPKT